MPLFLVVALVVALGFLVSTATTMVLNWGILKDQLWSWPEPKLPDGPDPFDLIKAALLVTGGIGGAVALAVAYRKQKWAEEDISGKRSAYASAATQLGDASPTVRLAGVYALANLADAWPEQRQQCVDVLCGHLRVPWNPEPKPVGTPPPGQNSVPTMDPQKGEDQVRSTILAVIADHLHPTNKLPAGAHSWSTLHLNLTNAEIPGWNVANCLFTGRLSAKALRLLRHQTINFAGADLSGANLSGANLTQADLYGVNLTKVDLSRANLTRADLTGADLTGANLTVTHLTEAFLYEANLTGANLTGANLTEAFLYEANLTKADLTGAKMTESDLTKADLTHAKLTGAKLTHAKLTNAKLTHANLYGADLTQSDLTKADLTHANLYGVNLTKANLDGANLTSANLTSASLTSANLAKANLTRADLTKANLTRADLTKADLTQANLGGADLNDAIRPEGDLPPIDPPATEPSINGPHPNIEVPGLSQQASDKRLPGSR